MNALPANVIRVLYQSVRCHKTVISTVPVIELSPRLRRFERRRGQVPYLMYKTGLINVLGFKCRIM